MEDKAKIRNRKQGGSALILVIVITVLLSMVGVLFIMMSRLSEMSTSAIRDDHDLIHASDVVVQRIEKVLMDDLFGDNRTSSLVDGKAGKNENYEFPNFKKPSSPGIDCWLSRIQPAYDDTGNHEFYQSHQVQWPFLTDLYYDVEDVFRPGYRPYGPIPGLNGGITISGGINANVSNALFLYDSSIDARVRNYPVGDPNKVAINRDSLLPNEVADADGDGIRDSLWIKIPDLRSSRGKNIYAAVRIIDNCGMLNLNTAWHLPGDSEGRYLSALDYKAFLRGADLNTNDPNQLCYARRADPDQSLTLPDYKSYHDDVIMNIESYSKTTPYNLFTISDELEMRNRMMLSSFTEARFERADTADSTFDANGGWYQRLIIPRSETVMRDFNGYRYPYFDDYKAWMMRVNPANFDSRTANSIYTNPPSDPLYVDKNYSYRYDRRHVCTFYSFDRNIMTGRYPLLEGRQFEYLFKPENHVTVNSALNYSDQGDPKIRKATLHLLYAYRAYFYEHESMDRRSAARKSAQIVANMIDYLDSDNDMTIIDWDFVDQLYQEFIETDPDYAAASPNKSDYEFGLDPADILFGFERQPYISEVYLRYDEPSGSITHFALELVNPYNWPIDLEGWRIRFLHNNGTDITFIIPSGQVIPPSKAPDDHGYFIISSEENLLVNLPDPLTSNYKHYFTTSAPLFGLTVRSTDIIQLQRPDPTSADPDNPFLTVDRTNDGQISPLFLTANQSFGRSSSRRNDNNWAFVNYKALEVNTYDWFTLGEDNKTSPQTANEGWQLPVADNSHPDGGRFNTLGQFNKVAWISNTLDPADPNSETIPVTYYISAASDEGEVRYDIEAAPELLKYISFIGRDNGRLPGRININTAPKEVIRAAIPTNNKLYPRIPRRLADEIAEAIVKDRDSYPFKSIADLVIDDPNEKACDEKIESLWYPDPSNDPNDDDLDGIKSDIDERDMILATLSNIFTVRSDVFTAYIAIRIGEPRWINSEDNNYIDDIIDNEPDRRIIAIFDRSYVTKPTDRPRLVGYTVVPDAR